jgi:hypothetical protein
MWEEVSSSMFSQNQYCGYTMPRVDMISTSRNLQNNSTHSVVVAFEHATFIDSIMVDWSLIFT